MEQTNRQDILGGWGGLVAGLILLHLAAFAFWVLQVRPAHARSSAAAGLVLSTARRAGRQDQHLQEGAQG